MMVKNKKGVILVELLFTIIIVSTISIFTMTLLYNLYEKYSTEHKNQVLKLESSSTQRLLEKVFSNSTNINVSSNVINFYKIDTKLFDLGYYSKFVDLNHTDTNKNSIYSPNTKAHYLINYSISFDNENFYEIKDDSYDEIINFEDTNSKEIKEQYKVVSKDHKLRCKDTTLYLDDNILLKNISSCTFNLSSNILSITLKINNTPFIWKYNL